MHLILSIGIGIVAELGLVGSGIRFGHNDTPPIGILGMTPDLQAQIGPVQQDLIREEVIGIAIDHHGAQLDIGKLGQDQIEDETEDENERPTLHLDVDRFTTIFTLTR